MAPSARWTAAAAMLLAITAPASALNLPFGLGQETARPAPGRDEAPMRMAQASDTGQRVMQLEEENRRLNGKVEELSFQMLQIQEQMRKMQEDNDFRFQELEGAASAGGAAPQKRSDVAPAAAAPPRASASAAPGSGDAEFSAAEPSAPAKAPVSGGDEIGSLLGGRELDVGSITPAPAPNAPAKSSGTVASVAPKGAGDLYALAYNYMLAGDYQLAEDSFRQYAQTYPDAKDVPDAQYWLGESLFAQAKYADAAETFLNAQKAHPKSGKAPEMMLKLGMSLSKLDNRETACVTFKEVARRYPQMSANVKRKLEAETKATSC